MKAVSAWKAPVEIDDKDGTRRFPWNIVLFNSTTEDLDGALSWGNCHFLAVEYGEEHVVGEELLSKIRDMAQRRGVRYIPGLYSGSTEGLSPVEILASAIGSTDKEPS